MSAILIPPGFKPVTFSVLIKRMPPLKEMVEKHLGMTETQTRKRIQELEARCMVQFAIAPNGEPSCFTDAQPDPLADLLVSFWDVTGKFDPTKGEIVSAQKNPTTTEMLAETAARLKGPHWQQALDQKLNAIDKLKIIERLPADHPRKAEISWMDMQDDLTALRAADVYSFNADTMHAIMTGAQSIPHESTLQSVEIPPSRAGWFWFAEPFPVAPSPVASDNTAALLWSWDTHLDVPALRFSAYVLDEKNAVMKGSILPSAKWLWPVNFSFHDMIALNTKLYRAAYGIGGKFHGQELTVGEAATMKVVVELALFFLMSCLWFRQTVTSKPKLTQETGHIERHARRRYEREFKTTPTVKVIALRKSAVTEHVGPSSETTRHLTVRFVVSGHARLQPCGPGRVDRKLIWIDPFVKGDPDAPFKESGPKVYAVVR